MSHGGGVRKVPKKCQVLFEWPLNRQREKIERESYRERQRSREKKDSQIEVTFDHRNFNKIFLNFTFLLFARVRTSSLLACCDTIYEQTLY